VNPFSRAFNALGGPTGNMRWGDLFVLEPEA
jgi:hypothetical protein